jgi:hypothetical protein
MKPGPCGLESVEIMLSKLTAWLLVIREQLAKILGQMTKLDPWNELKRLGYSVRECEIVLKQEA